MRRSRNAALVTVALTCLVGGSCNVGDAVSAAEGPAPSFSYCNGTPEQCDELDRRITELQNSTDPDCQVAGNSARDRYNSSTYGFEVSSESSDYGWVFPLEMPCSGQCDPLATYTTGITYMHPDNWPNGEVGRTVAHEEYHHNTGDTDHIAAENFAQSCF